MSYSLTNIGDEALWFLTCTGFFIAITFKAMGMSLKFRHLLFSLYNVQAPIYIILIEIGEIGNIIIFNHGHDVDPEFSQLKCDNDYI